MDVCPVQCIYEYDKATDTLFAEDGAGSGAIENVHAAAADHVAIFGDTILYVNLDECTSCAACYAPDVCPVGAIYPDDQLPDGSPGARYNANDEYKGNDHRFFLQLSRDVFAD